VSIPRHILFVYLLVTPLVAGCVTGEPRDEDMSSNCVDPVAGQVMTGETMSLLTLNASHGRKTAWNQMLVSTEQTRENLDAIADVLEETAADVVALQEADAPSRWSGKFDHVTYLRDRTSFNCSLLGEHADTWLYSFGTALLSRVAMENSRSVTFPSTPPTTTKGFVMTSVDWDDGSGAAPVTLVSVHLDFSRKSVRDMQTGILIDALREISGPFIVMGDLNSRWDQKRSHVRQLADELDLRVFEPDSDSLGTYKDEQGKRLDWILLSRALEFRRYEVLPGEISDHLAVFAEIGRSK
jgi:endonuclease/exonuclease/phosphatase family metal-dependent hydrolase